MPRQSQATSSVADMYSVVASEPSRYSSVQSFLPSQSDISKYSAQTTNLDSASHGGPSDPLEAPITESSSLESKPSTKVKSAAPSQALEPCHAMTRCLLLEVCARQRCSPSPLFRTFITNLSTGEYRTGCVAICVSGLISAQNGPGRLFVRPSTPS